MSKIIQYSTIGALMAGYTEGWQTLAELGQGDEFGIGCSTGVSGELTVSGGKIFEATAGEPVQQLTKHTGLPFIQLTRFAPKITYPVQQIRHDNAYQHLSRYIQADNILLAVSVIGHFEKMVIRRPQRSEMPNRDIREMAQSQTVDSFENIEGRLIGFWTPELYGRISVPGFHFHFIDDSQQVSGHVLEFSAEKATLLFEEKPVIEITNPTTTTYRNTHIDIDQLDDIISHVEK